MCKVCPVGSNSLRYSDHVVPDILVNIGSGSDLLPVRRQSSNT